MPALIPSSHEGPDPGKVDNLWGWLL
jgi:hypothetical protein